MSDTDHAAVSVAAKSRRFHVSTEMWRALGAFVLVLIIGAIFNANGAFFLAQTHSDALWQISGYGIMACGMTVVILTGGIDLSVGSIVALSGLVFFLLMSKQNPTSGGWDTDPTIPGWIAALAGIAVGALAGLVSGIIVAWMRVQPFIATLAVMAFVRGVAKSITSNRKVFPFPPPHMADLLSSRLSVFGFNVSAGAIVFVIIIAVTWFIVNRMTLGRYTYAIGDNEEAARLSGVPVRLTKILAYTYSGALAGLAGVLFAASVHQGDPDSGIGYELSVIAMVVVGGTSLMGGKGGVGLTVLGALTIGYLQKILNINAMQPASQQMITGVIIVLAVLAQGMRKR